MPVRTRRQAAASKSSNNKESKEKRKEKVEEPEKAVTNHDDWDIPDSKLTPSIIRTYSKQQPFRTYWSKKPSKNTQDSKVLSSESDSCAKKPRKKLSQEILSVSPSATVTKTPPTAKTSVILPSSVTVRKRGAGKRSRNKTRLVAESMTTCTMLAEQYSCIDLSVEDMSLCSVVHAETQDKIRNSTVLGDGRNMNQDFVPNEISAIEGENDLQDMVVSSCNEKTPDIQTIQFKNVKSAKKVRFDVSQKTPRAKPDHEPNAKRNIFRKTPYRNCKDADQECCKTSSPDPNKQISMLHCEISTLLMDDDLPKKKGSKNASNQITQDTEILLDFEPIPLQCSEHISETSKNITPEGCNSAVKDPTSSAKRRRRLSYHPDTEEIPACILLDAPVRKTKKKTKIWVWKNPHPYSIKDITSFPDDILL